MKLKHGMFFLLGILQVFQQTVAQDSSGGNGAVTSQSRPNDIVGNNVEKTIGLWLPHVNATCSNKQLQLADNPTCVAGKLKQTQRNCSQGVFKTGANGRGCVMSQREIACTADKACSDWSGWEQKTACCQEDECYWNGTKYLRNKCVFQRARKCIKDINKDCNSAHKTDTCSCGRAAGIPGNPDVNGGDGGKTGSKGAQSTSIQTIAFCLAGAVLVGLLLFAALRIRKSTQRSGEEGNFRREREIEGVDNAALGPLSPDSRIQSILDTINSNGRNYEVRERSDSLPGRRVYVLSPTTSDKDVGPHGRIFSRATSQLSSIAEESAEDALSHITEATEPADDDYIFKYDSDAINELDNGHSDCAFDESSKPASSSEAINCINDVIAMYDVEKEGENDIDGMLKRNSVMSTTDYRKTSELGGDDYLKTFGWEPSERPWRVEKLKDEASKTNGHFSASCSTLNSIYSERSAASSASLGACDVTTDAEGNSTEPLLGNKTSSSLQNSKAFKSLPSVLDTSGIPDIEEVLRGDDENGFCDVTANGSVIA